MKTRTSVTLDKSGGRAQSRRSRVGAVGQPRSGAADNRLRQPGDLKSILVPTDFSRSSKKALRYAVALARKIGSQITLVHVAKPRPIDSEGYPALLGCDPRILRASAALGKVWKEQHVEPSLLRNTVVREGTPHREIAEAARELSADLIVIATKGRRGLARVLLGSTTEKVVRFAPCPVLVVREEQREFIHN